MQTDSHGSRLADIDRYGLLSEDIPVCMPTRSVGDWPTDTVK